MIAAGRTVKKLHPEALTVFVGPCIAKKAEAREKDIAGAVDYVLTFQEIQQMLDMLQIDLTRQPNITREYSSGLGRIYARNGGVSQAVAKTLERLHPNRKIKLNAQKADGVPECRRMCMSRRRYRKSRILPVTPLCCPNGRRPRMPG